MKKKVHPVMASYYDESFDLVKGVRRIVNDPKFKDYMQRLDNLCDTIQWNLNDEDRDEVLYQLTHPAYNSGDNCVRFFNFCKQVIQLLRDYN